MVALSSTSPVNRDLAKEFVVSIHRPFILVSFFSLLFLSLTFWAVIICFRDPSNRFLENLRSL